MTILAVDVDELTCVFLTQSGLPTERLKRSLLEDFDITEWVTVDGLYTGCIVNVDTLGSLSVCRGLRAKKVDVPVVGISSPTAAGDSWPERRATFLEQGGDDLIQLPLNPRELVASMRAAQRRAQRGLLVPVLTATSGQAVLKVNTHLQAAFVDNYRLTLTPMEYHVLEVLMRANGTVLSRERIVSRIYAVADDTPDPKIVDVVLCRLRRKMGEVHPDAPALIGSVRGAGFRIVSGAGTS